MSNLPSSPSLVFPLRKEGAEEMAMAPLLQLSFLETKALWGRGLHDCLK